MIMKNKPLVVEQWEYVCVCLWERGSEHKVQQVIQNTNVLLTLLPSPEAASTKQYEVSPRYLGALPSASEPKKSPLYLPLLYPAQFRSLPQQLHPQLLHLLMGWQQSACLRFYVIMISKTATGVFSKIKVYWAIPMVWA